MIKVILRVVFLAKHDTLQRIGQVFHGSRKDGRVGPNKESDASFGVIQIVPMIDCIVVCTDTASAAIVAVESFLLWRQL